MDTAAAAAGGGVETAIGSWWMEYATELSNTGVQTLHIEAFSAAHNPVCHDNGK